MNTCWSCSTELTGKICTNCNALNQIGDTRIAGVLHRDDVLTIFKSASDDSELLIQLHRDEAKLKSLPRANKRNAIRSKPFRGIWHKVTHGLSALAEVEPKRYRLRRQSGVQYLSILVDALPEITIQAPAVEAADLHEDQALASDAAADAHVDAPSIEDADVDAASAEESAPAEEATTATVEAVAADEATADATPEDGPAEDVPAPVDDTATEHVSDVATATPEEAAEAATEADGAEEEGADEAPLQAEASDDTSAEEAAVETPEEDSVADVMPVAETEETPEFTAPASTPAEEDMVPIAAHGDPTTLPLAVLPEAGPSAVQRLEALQAEMNALSSHDELAASLETLKQHFELPKSSRRMAENLLLCITYARLALKTDQLEIAGEALARAFELDPGDKEVLTTYNDLLELTGGDAALKQRINLNLLLHHRDSLAPGDLSGVYRQLGLWQLSQQNLDRARTNFEQALDANSSDREALDLLLKTVSEQGDPEQIIKVRQRLFEQTKDPAGRAMLQVSIGDDYLDRLNDIERAIEAYETSLKYHVNVDALKKLAQLAKDREDWSRAARIIEQLTEHTESNDEKIVLLSEAAQIYRQQLWNLDAAANVLEKILDLDPSKINALKALASLHKDAKNWTGLQASYERMLERLEDDESSLKVKAVVFFKLGELFRHHLDNRDQAIAMYLEANAITPDSPQVLQALAELHAQASDSDTESLDMAIAINRKLLTAPLLGDPKNLEILGTIARLHLRKQDFDQAYCIYRGLTLLGKADVQAQRLVDQYNSTTLTPLKADIDSQTFVNALLGKNYAPVLGEIFDICREALTKRLAHDLDHYSLRKKDRIDRQEGLMFNNIYHQIAGRLTYPEAPPVYKKDDQKGLINASLYPPGFIVGTQLLSASEKVVAFTIAKQLSLFMNPSFLIQLQRLQHLQLIILTVIKMFRPQTNLPSNKAMEQLTKEFKNLKEDKKARLRSLMDTFLTNNNRQLDAHITQLQDTFEDAANRCGLLFCDDISACAEALNNEPNPVRSARSADDRIRALLEWSLSPEYASLRRQLGIAIDQR